MEFMKGKAAVWFLLANIIITLTLLFFTLKIYIISPSDYVYSPTFGLALFIMNCFSIIFIFLFLFTYCISERGCCCNKNEAGYQTNVPFDCCEEMTCCCECCYGLGPLLFFPLHITIIFAIYHFNGICGRHASRLTHTIILFIINFTICMISLYVGINFAFDIFIILTFIFSLFGAICNLLAVLLPNTVRGRKLRHDYKDEDDYLMYNL